MNPPPPSQRLGGWGFGLIFGFLAAGIILLGALYLRHQEAAARATAQAEIEAIADLKVQQIVNWRKERLADAEMIRATPYFARRALDALARPGEARTGQMFMGWLKPLLAVGCYERALLLDDRLNVRLVHPEGASHTLSETARGSAEEALRTRQVVASDLHRSEKDTQVYMDFMVPFVVRREGTNNRVPAAGLGPAPGDRSAAVLVLKLNAHDYLFPFLQTWPTASPSAETLLVRREGQEVLYLNDLRHQKGTAMKLRRSLAEARLPAAMGLRGEKGVHEGIDYRGVRVVAAVRPVPDTPWVMVAKVDAAEIYAPLRREALGAAAVALALIVAAAFGLTALWRHNREYFLHAQLVTEREQRAFMEQAQAEIQKLNRELEQRVQERTAALKASNQELESFCHSVSHDLRAPLRHVSGYAGLLRTSAGPMLAEEDRHFLEEINGAAREMGKLIDALLLFSRMGRTQMRQQPLELTELVDESIRQLKSEANGRNILWKRAPLPAVQADPVLLRQVLINLLSNAVKYTRPRDPAEIEIGCASKTGQETVIFIRDNGVGFDMEYGNKLFEVFQRLHAAEDFEGTGIGLANVRRIITRHGGRTWAEGKVDAGATFYFSLPANTGEPVATGGSRRTSPAEERLAPTAVGGYVLLNPPPARRNPLAHLPHDKPKTHSAGGGQPPRNRWERSGRS